MIIVAAILADLLQCVAARTFTVANNCPFTIWPAMFTDLNVGSAVPNMSTGWEAGASTSVSFDVPNDWRAGRIWARRACDFSTNPGPSSCITGGCNGGLVCDARTGTGVPPASVAGWTLAGDGNRDFYATPLVDGHNLPLRIANSAGCPVADCPADLAPSCPDRLRGPADAAGAPAGCRSACQANLDGTPTDSANCCSGSHNTAATCPPAGVEFYSHFKNGCPNSYVYAYDEASGTALWQCDSARNADYTLTFCPPSTSTSGASSAGSGAAPGQSATARATESASVPPSNPSNGCQGRCPARAFIAAAGVWSVHTALAAMFF